MQTASDDFEHRLLPMTAGDYYAIRYRLSVVADLLRVAANGAPISPVEMEDMWLDMTTSLVVLESAWAERRANLRVVK